MIRFARQVLWLHPDDCIPPHGLDLTDGSRDSIKVERLFWAFISEGFDPKEPALVGYPDGSGISSNSAGLGGRPVRLPYWRSQLSVVP